MSLEIRADRFFVGLWYFDLPLGLCQGKSAPGLGGNWMGAVWREAASESDWVFEYRFRYYKTPEPFNDPEDPMRSIDEFSWWSATIKGMSLEEVFLSVSNSVKMIAGAAGTEAEFLELNCPGGDEALEKMQNSGLRWLHWKFERKEKG